MKFFGGIEIFLLIMIFISTPENQRIADLPELHGKLRSDGKNQGVEETGKLREYVRLLRQHRPDHGPVKEGDRRSETGDEIDHHC